MTPAAIIDPAEIRARKTLEQLERAVNSKPQQARGPRPTPIVQTKDKRKRLTVRASRRANRAR